MEIEEDDLNYKSLEKFRGLAAVDNLTAFVFDAVTLIHFLKHFRACVGSHDIILFEDSGFLSHVISLVAQTNTAHFSMRGLKQYVNGTCGLVFVQDNSLFFHALIGEAGQTIWAKAFYFRGVVAVPDWGSYSRAMYLFEETVSYPELDERDEQFIIESFRDPLASVVLFNPHKVDKDGIQGLRKVVYEKSGRGRVIMARKKTIRTMLGLAAGISQCHHNIWRLLSHVSGECGLVFLHADTYLLGLVLRLVSVKAVYMLGYSVPLHKLSTPAPQSICRVVYPIEYLVENVLNQSKSTNTGDISNLHIILKQAHESLQAESIRLRPLLDLLDPSLHSLGYLYILEACFSAVISEGQARDMVETTTRFISSCDKAQIQLAPGKFISVCRRFKDHVLQLEDPARGVAPLLTAIRKIQRSPAHYTSLHPEFLVLCLLSKYYKVGYSILHTDISEVDPRKDLFLYCYYGGMICIGQKCYQKALDFFHIVLTSPLPTFNALATEAFKKYILVSLIQNGQFSTSWDPAELFQEEMWNDCQPYIELARRSSTGNVADLERIAESYMEYFQNDNNLGLVKQAISFMYKCNIKEAEINQNDGMVSFHEDPEIEDIESSIQKECRRIMALSM